MPTTGLMCSECDKCATIYGDLSQVEEDNI